MVDKQVTARLFLQVSGFSGDGHCIGNKLNDGGKNNKVLSFISQWDPQLTRVMITLPNNSNLAASLFLPLYCRI